MSLNLFYSKVVNNLGLYVDEDGFIYSSNKANKVPITNEGKPLVLPTVENINSIFTTDEDGNTIATKSLFNPMNEDVIKGDSPSLKKMKTLAERRMGHVVYLAGELLLTLASNQELQKKTPIQINKFLKRVREGVSQGVRQAVDDKTIEAWEKLYNKTLNRPQGMFSIYLKKSGSIDGVKFNRLATLSSQVYDELLAVGEEGKVLEVTLRKKDVAIFKVIFQYLVPEFEDGDTLSIGSDDPESPAFISLLQLYLKVIKKTNMVLKSLHNINQEIADSGYLDDVITDEEIADISKYVPELKNIPNEHDLNRQVVQQEKQQTNLSKLSQPVTQRPVIPGQNNPVFQQQRIPDTPVEFNTPGAKEDPLLKALGRSAQANQMQMNTPMGINNIPQQPMYMPQQPIGFQQPMGINTFQQPIQQPMLFQQQQQPFLQQYNVPPMGINNMYR